LENTENKEPKEWRIPVSWQVYGIVKVEADTLSEAIVIARDDEGIIPLPTESHYVDGSWQLSSSDIDEVRSCYNANRQDG
jgi:hypothetical protein